MQTSIRGVRVDDSVLEYIADIVGRTRSHRSLYFGASPRASIALLAGAQARAAAAGRDFVIPDDVKALAPGRHPPPRRPPARRRDRGRVGRRLRRRDPARGPRPRHHRRLSEHACRWSRPCASCCSRSAPLALGIGMAFDASLLAPMLAADGALLLLAAIDALLVRRARSRCRARGARRALGRAREPDPASAPLAGAPAAGGHRHRRPPARRRRRQPARAGRRSPRAAAPASSTTMRPSRRGAVELGDHTVRYPLAARAVAAAAPPARPRRAQGLSRRHGRARLRAARPPEPREPAGPRASRLRGGENEFERLREYAARRRVPEHRLEGDGAARAPHRPRVPAGAQPDRGLPARLRPADDRRERRPGPARSRAERGADAGARRGARGRSAGPDGVRRARAAATCPRRAGGGPPSASRTPRTICTPTWSRPTSRAPSPS